MFLKVSLFTLRAEIKGLYKFPQKGKQAHVSKLLRDLQGAVTKSKCLNEFIRKVRRGTRKVESVLPTDDIHAEASNYIYMLS